MIYFLNYDLLVSKLFNNEFDNAEVKHMASLTMTDLYKSAFQNIVATLRDLYVDAEEGTIDNLLMKVRISGDPSYGSNLISYYYIPIQVRKLWSQHYSQVVLDQVETANRITITTDASMNMDMEGAAWVQNCISAMITNRIQLTKSEILNKYYSHAVYITENGCMSLSVVSSNTNRVSYTLAEPGLNPVEVFENWNLVTDRYISMRPVSNTDPGPGGEDPDDPNPDLTDDSNIYCVTNDDGSVSWMCGEPPIAEEENSSEVTCDYDESTGTHTWTC